MARAHSSPGSQVPSVELTWLGQRFSVTGPLIAIGRGADNDVVINDPEVSRHHLSLTWDGRRYVIQDLGTPNGTFVNGARLTATQAVQSGDVIGLGATVALTFQTVAPPVAAGTAIQAAKRGSRGKGWAVLPLMAVALAVCGLLAVAAAAGYYFLRPKPVGLPLVLINSPRHGEQVEVGREMTIRAVARDAGKVARVELWVDGQLHEAQDSSLPGGTSPFPLLVRWRPTSPGNHTLIAQAINTQGGRAQAAISVQAVQGTDRDGDGVPDAQDACPDQLGSRAADGCPNPADAADPDGDGLIGADDACPDQAGPPVAQGCPDADHDGVPDAQDACPDQPGIPGGPAGDGCPAPAENDRDGDGLPDDQDACPDQAGSAEAGGCPDADGDGVRDDQDACPDEPGLPAHDGCPATGDREDSDGDGIPDSDDTCPAEWGPPESGGCPDADGDGVPDSRDLAPDEPGPPEGGGVPGGGPGGGAPDRDGDGVPDSADHCPDEAGRPEDDGCPPPDVSESDDGGSGLFPPDDVGTDVRVPVEFDALAFSVDREYSYVNCYVSLAGSDRERFEFEPLGERQWDIVARLGGENSRTVLAPPEGPLEVRADCGGEVVYLGPEGGEGTYYPLGTIIMSHFPAEWDGRELTARGEVEGHWFEAKYRICLGSCENAAFPPPILALTEIGGGPGHEPSMRFLTWHWGGDRTTISGFKLYVNGNFSRSPRPDLHSYELQGGLIPACGERLEFQLTAYSGATLVPERESPRSNTVVVEALPCLHRTVRVTFDRLETGSLEDGDPNRNWREHRLGPIFGSFWAQGSDEVDLAFNGVDGLDGLMLSSDTTPSVQSLFDWILAEISHPCGGSACRPYYAPESSTVTVELGPDDDLTFGGVIYEQDYRTYGEVFNRSRTIAADDLQDIRPNLYYMLYDGPIALRVRLDVVSSYEVGGTKPDLTVTGVTTVGDEYPGPLNIHVRNNNADMTNQRVTIALARIRTNELIGSYTWENVTIRAGEERMLQTSIPIEEGGLRVMLDPDNLIEETNDGNNIYETPVVMRVEVTRLFVGSPCETFLSCNTYHWFFMWVGHGPSRTQVQWVGDAARYPASGTIRHHTCSPEDNVDWLPATEDPARYVFEFEMPADENLYISLAGHEDDVFSDDYMGHIDAAYTPSQQYGARSEQYRASSTDVADCDDGITPLGWDYFGFEAWWRITQVR
jgi:hypothetical protein